MSVALIRVLDCSNRAYYNITSKCCLNDDHNICLFTFLILYISVYWCIMFGAGVRYVSTLFLLGLLKGRNRMVKVLFCCRL